MKVYAWAIGYKKAQIRVQTWIYFWKYIEKLVGYDVSAINFNHQTSKQMKFITYTTYVELCKELHKHNIEPFSYSRRSTTSSC